MKYVVIFAFVVILGSLASALFFMMKNDANNQERAQRMAFSLALRVGFSIMLFASILVAWKLGYISPTGVP